MKKNTTLFENRLAKYSMAAGAILVITSPIKAKIVKYTDNKTLANGDDSYPITFNGDTKFKVSPSNSSFLLKCSTGEACIATIMSSRYKIFSSTSTINDLNGTNWRNSALFFNSRGNLSGAGDKYIGVKFKDTDDKIKYGWILVNVASDAKSTTIKGHAYEDAGSAIPCPVELTSFSAVHFENAVKLLWQTATEVNNYGFDIQRSVISNQLSEKEFETIGFVEGHGNSNSPKYYEFIDETAPADNLEYRLKQIDTDGNYEYYSLTAKVDNNVTDVEDNSLPLDFALEQNYPNPFNPSTAISYQLSAVSKVELKVFDLLGKEVATLVNKEQAAGNYSINFDASGLPSGMYIYRITAGEFTQARKMLLLR